MTLVIRMMGSGTAIRPREAEVAVALAAQEAREVVLRRMARWAEAAMVLADQGAGMPSAVRTAEVVVAVAASQKSAQRVKEADRV